MKKSDCKHDKKDLVLHFYGELEDAESAEVDVRLNICSECMSYYAELLGMETVIPRSPSVEPDEAVMDAVRSATARRLRERQASQARKTKVRGFESGRAIWKRASLVTAVVMLAFVGGRWSVSFNRSSVSGADSPSIAGISDLVYDAESGLVNVQYRSVDAATMRGSLDDDRIRTLVEHALVNPDSPATRLRAVKLLNAVDVDLIRPDQDLVSALAFILKEDANSGMKLQAISALRRVHEGTELNTELTGILMEIMDESDNSALRIEALELLTASEMARQDLSRLLARAARDENSFIRFRARSALQDMQGTIPLDQIQ